MLAALLSALHRRVEKQVVNFKRLLGIGFRSKAALDKLVVVRKESSEKVAIFVRALLLNQRRAERPSANAVVLLPKMPATTVHCLLQFI